MPRLPVPLPARSMVPVEIRPAEGGNRLPPEVSIRIPTASVVPVLAMKPLLFRDLLELIVTTGVAAVVRPMPPLVAMEISPALEVTSAVLVLVVILVSARAAATAASRAAAAAESIKRCLVNTTSFKILAPGSRSVRWSAAIALREGPLSTPPPGKTAGSPSVCPVPGHPSAHMGSRWGLPAPLYPAMVPVQQQISCRWRGGATKNALRTGPFNKPEPGY